MLWCCVKWNSYFPKRTVAGVAVELILATLPFVDPTWPCRLDRIDFSLAHLPYLIRQITGQREGSVSLAVAAFQPTLEEMLILAAAINGAVQCVSCAALPRWCKQRGFCLPDQTGWTTRSNTMLWGIFHPSARPALQCIIVLFVLGLELNSWPRNLGWN